MTYEGIFEKCKTIKEAYDTKKRLLGQFRDDLSRNEIEKVFFRRCWELREEKGCLKRGS